MSAGQEQHAVGGLQAWLWVGVQGLLFLGLGLWPASVGGSVSQFRLVAAVAFVLGAAVIIAASVGLKRALTPVPVPNGAGMSARGVYRWVRHPMYTGVLVVALAVALARGSVVVWLFAGALLVFFEAKTRIEERMLVVTYPQYRSYAQITGKFIPGLGKYPPG